MVCAMGRTPEPRSTTRVLEVPAYVRLLNGRDRSARADLGDSTLDVYRFVIQNGDLGQRCSWFDTILIGI